MTHTPKPTLNAAANSPIKRAIIGMLISLQIAPLGLWNSYAQSAAFTAAPVVVAPSTGPKPVVTTAGNGVPVVNIAPPSAAGVSNNTYTQFNVGTPGLIFNNSGGNSQTQLGGWVSGNPMIGNNTATTILNQVNGNLPSNLNGYMEVAGTPANVVVANPNGITCAGCGFINTPNATLTTGQVQQTSTGAITGVNVTQGQITVNGQGLDASGVNQLDILTRSAVINANIWVGQNTSSGQGQINVITGVNQITTDGQGAATTQGTPTVSTSTQGNAGAPSVALDVTNLGGMYAGAVRLIGTEAGLGVNTAGTLQAGSGNLQLSNTGQISFGSTSQTQAAGNITVNASQGGVNNQGAIYSTGNVQVQSLQGTTDNTGFIGAQGNVSVSANSVTQASTGTLAAGINWQGNVTQAGTATVNAGQLNSAGQILAGGNATITTQGNATLSQGLVAAGNTLTVGSGNDLNNGNASLTAHTINLTSAQTVSNVGGYIGAAQVNINAANLNNTGGVIQAVSTDPAQGNLTLTVGSATGTGTINNADNSQLYASGTINITTGTLNNTGTASASQASQSTAQPTQYGIQGNAVNVNTNTLDNATGVLQAQGNATLNTQNLSNTQGTLLTGNNLTVNAALLGSDGHILGINDVTLNINGTYTNNANGSAPNTTASLQAGNNLTINATGVTNTGLINAGNTTTLNATTITNTSTGEINGTHTVINAQGTAAQAATVTNAGLIDGYNTVIRVTDSQGAMTSGTLDNTGRIYGDNIALQANTLSNTGPAVIAARQQLNIGVTTLNNQDGGSASTSDNALIYSAGNINIGGALDANNNVTGGATTVNNLSSTIEAAGNITINTGTLNNINRHFTTTIQVVGTPEDLTLIQQDGTLGKIDETNLIKKYTKYNAMQYYVWNTAIPANGGTPGQTPLVLPGTQVCTGTPEVCVDAQGSDYVSTNPAWAYFAITPPTPQPTEPIAPVAPTAPNPAGAASCQAGPGYNATSCTAYTQAQTQYTQDLAAYNLALTQFNTDYANYEIAQEAWALANDPQYEQLHDAISTYNATYGTGSGNIINYTKYNITRTNSETAIATTDAAQIIAGGNINLNASVAATNDQSRILAGGNIQVTGSTLNNVGYTGQHIVNDIGTARHHGTQRGWYNWKRITKDAWGGIAAYTPADIVTPVTLNVFQEAQNQSINSTTTGAAANNNTLASVTTPTGSILAPTPNTSVPANGLYQVNTSPGNHPLIETDPRYANYRDWLSSDYLLAQLGQQPNVVLQRLGDGFYEQKLIQEQIIAATGQRLIGDYQNNQTQYQALMQGAVNAANTLQLTVGTALTPEQMRLLTTDIVWLVAQTITLPNGTTTQALVPQVYLRVQPGDLQANGSLISGRNVVINMTGAVNNAGGISANNLALIKSGQNINNLAGGVITGNTIALMAANDINNTGGTLTGTGVGSQIYLNAGNNVNIASTTQTQTAGLAPAQANAAAANPSERPTLTGGAGSMRPTAQASVVGSMGGLGSMARRNSQPPTPAVGTTSSRTDLSSVASLSADNIQILAGNDLTILGAQINSAGDVVLSAGRDVVVGTVQTSEQTNINFGNNKAGGNHLNTGSTTQVGTTLGVGGNLSVQAGTQTPATPTGAGNITLTGATVQVGGTTNLIATGNVNLAGAQNTSNYSQQVSQSSGNVLSKSSSTSTVTSNASTAQGTSITGGALNIKAGNDINTAAANVNVQGALALQAGNDINIGTAQNTQTDTYSASSKSSGISASVQSGVAYGKSSSTQNSTSQASMVQGTSLQGGSISMTAARDVTITASQVIADQDVDITAKRNLTIQAGQNTSHSQSDSTSKSTSIGLVQGLAPQANLFSSNKTTQNGTQNATTHTGSVIGSIGGNVNLKAGNALAVKGSDLIAAQDINVRGASVAITEVIDTSTTVSTQDSKSVSVSVGVGGVLGNAANTVYDSLKQADQAQDPRLQALLGVKAARAVMDANTALDAANKGMQEGKAGAGAGLLTVKVNVGASKSHMDATSTSSTAVGSSLTGNNINITATGTDLEGKAVSQSSNPNSGNLTIQGSTVKAKQGVALEAQGDINLLASANTTSNRMSTNSKSAGVSVEYDVVTQNTTVSANANKANGATNTDSTSYNNTQILGNTVSLKSGNDTTLKGAQVAGNTVIADIGGNLTIQSLQGSDTYHDKQSSKGAGASTGGAAGTNASASVSSGKTDSTYLSVTQQSGIAAGDGGYQIKVAGATTLIGGAITSTQAAVDNHNNSFDTQSLTTSELTNSASYSSKTHSAGVSTNMSVSQLALAGATGALGGMGQNGDASSTTHSTITGYTGKGSDGKTIATTSQGLLNTTTTSQASTDGKITLPDAKALEQIFDANKIKEQAQMASLIGEQGFRLVGDIAQALDLKEGSAGKIFMHGAMGALQATLGGAGAAGILASTTGAALNEALLPALIEYTKTQYPEGSEDYKAALKLGSLLIGTVTGVAVGGASGANAAGNTTLAATTNNYLKHEQWKQLADKLADCKKSGADCSAVEAAYRKLNIANDNALAAVCQANPQSAECSAMAQDAKASQSTQDSLGVDDSVLGAGSQARANLLANQYLVTPEAMAQAQVKCNANPSTCLSKPEGVASVAIGVGKGVVNAPGALLNTVPLAVQGYINISEFAMDQPLTEVPKIPDILDYDTNNPLEKLGGVAGEIVGGAAILKVVEVGAGLVSGASLDAKAAADANKVKVENNFYAEGASSTPSGLNTTAGVISANPNKTTTVLGRWTDDMDSVINNQMNAVKTEDFGAKPGGFNVLNVDDAKATASPNFFEQYNKPFLDQAVKRGDDIALATIPNMKRDIINERTGELIGSFAKELDYLVKNNYKPSNITSAQWDTIKGWFK